MAITAADVMKLRKMTAAGMMDCKKALEEAEGDFEKAIGIIREKGKLVAAKRADRETSEGAVKARIQDGKGIIIVLGCETDFVSRNTDFQNLAETIADVAIANCPADIEALKACKMPDGYTVAEAIEAQTGKTGEKHVLVGYALVEAPFVAAYIHKINGKLGALVGFNKPISESLAKGVVMQVASMNPVSIGVEDCPQSILDEEKNVAIQKTKEELVQKAIDAALKKAGINPAHVDSEDHIESNTTKGWITPEQAEQARQIIKTVGEEKAASLNMQMVENIANGRVQKFFKESTLEEQEFVQSDEKMTVANYIKSVDAEAKVVAFKRFSLSD